MILKGATRLVILTRCWAFKLPRFDWGWEAGLNGLLANMQESKFSACGWPELCPVRLSLPGGFLVVMPRVRPLSDVEWAAFDPEAFCNGRHKIPAEYKRCSFGRLAGRIVAVDYG